MTTSTQIDAMRALCGKLEENSLVSEAILDDWGQFGNFQVLLTPKEQNRYATRRITALVKKLLVSEKVGAHLRQVFGPDPITRVDYRGKRKVIGYKQDYWVVDIDFQAYHAASNTFSA